MLTNQDSMFPQSHDLLNLQQQQQQQQQHLFEQFQPPQFQPPRQQQEAQFFHSLKAPEAESSGGRFTTTLSFAPSIHIIPASQLHQFQQQQAPQQFQQQQAPQQIQQQQAPQQFQQQQAPQQQQQSLASHFHLLHLIEKLAHPLENGTRDQHSDVLVSELTNQFEKCQQLLNTIAGSLSSKNVTVESQKCKLEETEQLLSQQRELISSYRKSLEGLIRPEPELLQRLSTYGGTSQSFASIQCEPSQSCTL